jgi:hypothetical protein
MKALVPRPWVKLRAEERCQSDQRDEDSEGTESSHGQRLPATSSWRAPPPNGLANHLRATRRMATRPEAAVEDATQLSNVPREQQAHK